MVHIEKKKNHISFPSTVIFPSFWVITHLLPESSEGKFVSFYLCFGLKFFSTLGREEFEVCQSFFLILLGEKRFILFYDSEPTEINPLCTLMEERGRQPSWGIVRCIPSKQETAYWVLSLLAWRIHSFAHSFHIHLVLSQCCALYQVPRKQERARLGVCPLRSFSPLGATERGRRCRNRRLVAVQSRNSLIHHLHRMLAHNSRHPGTFVGFFQERGDAEEGWGQIQLVTEPTSPWFPPSPSSFLSVHSCQNWTWLQERMKKQRTLVVRRLWSRI